MVYVGSIWLLGCVVSIAEAQKLQQHWDLAHVASGGMVYPTGIAGRQKGQSRGAEARFRVWVARS